MHFKQHHFVGWQRKRPKKQFWINQLASMWGRIIFFSSYSFSNNCIQFYGFEFRINLNTTHRVYCSNLKFNDVLFKIGACRFFFSPTNFFISMFENSLFIFEQKCAQHKLYTNWNKPIPMNEQKSNKTTLVLAHCSNSISECKIERMTKKHTSSKCYTQK